MVKLAEHTMPRNIASVYAIIFGSFIGIYSSIFSPVQFALNPGLFFWMVAAISSIVILHEAVHGFVAVLFGIKPFFGHKFPTVYVTFKEIIPRNQFLIIAIAPFIILDVIFVLLFAGGFNKIYCYFCLVLNTAGSFGDLWIAIKLFRHQRGTVVQDLKTGFEVWRTE
jgi:hypothetical protein